MQNSQADQERAISKMISNAQQDDRFDVKSVEGFFFSFQAKQTVFTY
jgi:hypothetical protein